MSTEVANPLSASLPADPGTHTPSSSEKEDVNGGLAMRGGSELPQATAHSALTADSPVAGLPMQLDVTVPIPSFRVGNLIALEKGAVLESRLAPRRRCSFVVWRRATGVDGV